MAKDAYTLAGEGAVWMQPNGPNTAPQYLGCFDVGDIDEPLGDLTLVYCTDPSGPNKWKAVGSYQGEPGAIKTSLKTKMRKTAAFLELQKCPYPLYVNHVSCGRMDVFNNWDRSFILEQTWTNARKTSGIASSVPGDQKESELAFDVSAETLLRAFELTAARDAIAETEDITDITSCNSESCGDDCGAAVNAGDSLFVGSKVLAGSAVNTADMWYSTDAGASWTIGLTDPFIAGEVIIAIRCVQKDKNTTRILVARGTTDAGNPAEVRYSDDGGLTWTTANLGSTVGTYCLGPKSLFVLDFYHIWAVTTTGGIYFSSDGGATFTVQGAGITVQNLWAIVFSDTLHGYAVGAANAIVKTTDGGVTWTVVTGPAANAAVIASSLEVISYYKVWVAYANGTLYYTLNGGTTWTQRLFGATGGVVPYVEFYDEYFGVLINNLTAVTQGSVWYTINGGYDWKQIVCPTNLGLNSLLVISPRLIWASGNLQGGTGVILKVSPV